MTPKLEFTPLEWKKMPRVNFWYGFAAGGLHVATVNRDQGKITAWLEIDVDYEYNYETTNNVPEAKKWADAEWVRLLRSWTKWTS